MSKVPDDVLRKIRAVIGQFREQNRVLWKPHSAARHLRKRINKSHLPSGTTLVD